MHDDADEYERSVFINCPFDEDYQPLFDAIAFGILACGQRPRCAKERIESGEIRLHKILGLIEGCRYGIHDLSRTRVGRGGTPRFNMPFELGLFMAAKWFGDERQQGKRYLILDAQPHRYKKSTSDISGQDVEIHGNDPQAALTAVRDFLSGQAAPEPLPGGSYIWQQYLDFQEAEPGLRDSFKLAGGSISFPDRLRLARHWLDAEAGGETPVENPSPTEPAEPAAGA